MTMAKESDVFPLGTTTMQSLMPNPAVNRV